MLDTTTPHPQPSRCAAASDVPDVDLRALDDRSVLTFVVDARRSADREEANLLAGVVHWADLHPVTPTAAGHPRQAAPVMRVLRVTRVLHRGRSTAHSAGSCPPTQTTRDVA